MLYHELEFPGGFRPQRTWDFEYFQRDASYEQVFPKLVGTDARAPRLGDVMIVADVDEIPRPQTLRVLHIGPEWHHPQATYYDGQQTLTPNNLRAGRGSNFISRWLESGTYSNSGWHCSSCFDSIELYLNKMASFSHKWMNGDAFRDRDRIADAVRESLDIWGRKGNKFERLNGNEDLPPIIGEDERFKYLKDRSGKSAGMKDYP
ncbi:hypothetical protein NLG97_g8575 [Lecanicillium saksenae]|uniref:Uncharacterized protein n=1 Tax=Lecanicillium saksenae TaxID=468837 RepID=A0ACC1QJ37_9HYPO|nr:hypothetical protein NLG97_g8575 [Lecanicillium saksenae]